MQNFGNPQKVGVKLGRTWRVVPGDGIPSGVEVLRSNNNLDATVHEGNLYLAFRSAPTHFASPKTRIHVLSSRDWGTTWSWEATFEHRRDVREPRLLSWNEALFLYYFTAGTSALSFAPERIYATRRNNPGNWSEPVAISEKGYVVWRTKVAAVPGSETPRPFMIRYKGGSQVYSLTSAAPRIQVELLTTEDGFDWRPIDDAKPVVYEGGGSETDFAFDAEGYLWGIIRNEAGDSEGWGSKLCWAPPGSYSQWTCTADRRKFDSPLVFECEGEVYLIARRNKAPWGENFDLGWRLLPRNAQWVAYELAYWLSPKRTALFRIDRDRRRIEHILDLPSKGDTAFPAIVQRPDRSHLVFNYSSDIEGWDKPWIVGQLTPTSIYATEMRFTKA